MARDMSTSKSIESQDPVWILQRATGHLMTGGENFTDDDYVAVSEMTKRIVSLMGMRSGPEQTSDTRGTRP